MVSISASAVRCPVLMTCAVLPVFFSDHGQVSSGICRRASFVLAHTDLVYDSASPHSRPSTAMSLLSHTLSPPIQVVNANSLCAGCSVSGTDIADGFQARLSKGIIPPGVTLIFHAMSGAEYCFCQPGTQQTNNNSTSSQHMVSCCAINQQCVMLTSGPCCQVLSQCTTTETNRCAGFLHLMPG